MIKHVVQIIISIFFILLFIFGNLNSAQTIILSFIAIIIYFEYRLSGKEDRKEKYEYEEQTN